MKRLFTCYQWLIRDNQQLHYQYFIITRKHYTNRQDVNKDWAPENTEFCFHPIKPIKESKLTGEFAEAIYYQERVTNG